MPCNGSAFPEGLEIHHNADLPARAGLGSSSSFTVGFLNALQALQGRLSTKYQLALDAIHVEQELLKENVGCQDQTAAAFGGSNKIEFGGMEQVKVSPMVCSRERLERAGESFASVLYGYVANGI